MYTYTVLGLDYDFNHIAVEVQANSPEEAAQIAGLEEVFDVVEHLHGPRQ